VVKNDSALSTVREIMIEFVRSTGLSPAGEHRDINMVMLATALGPESFLSI
jgi:hypothetical protein